MKLLRKIHRWSGLLFFALLVFYCTTGLLLNHRRAFDYFVDRQRQTMTVAPVDISALRQVIDRYVRLAGEEMPPTVVKIKPDSTVELLYGSHGVVTYVFPPDAGTMEKITKKPRQPLHWLNRLHKVFRTTDGWLAVADLAAAGLLHAGITGLFIFRYRPPACLLLVLGLALTLTGFLLL